jgi:DNA-binding MarR family transcriptional regulator
MKEIAGIIDKDKSTVTALVNKLIHMGYVEKRKSPDDNRISIIAVTQKGETLKPAFVSIAKKLRSLAYKGITENEREILFNLLNRIDTNI